MIELLCELVHERIRLISNSDGKTPPEDLRGTLYRILLYSLLYADDERRACVCRGDGDIDLGIQENHDRGIERSYKSITQEIWFEICR
jgi:hypothetical protein